MRKRPVYDRSVRHIFNHGKHENIGRDSTRFDESKRPHRVTAVARHEEFDGRPLSLDQLDDDSAGSDQAMDGREPEFAVPTEASIVARGGQFLAIVGTTSPETTCHCSDEVFFRR